LFFFLSNITQKAKKVEVEKQLVATRDKVESLREQLLKAERELQDLDRQVHPKNIATFDLFSVLSSFIQNELLTLKAASLSHTAIPKLSAPVSYLLSVFEHFFKFWI